MCSLHRVVFVFPQVGFKPAGGIRTAQESLVWLALIKEELGNDWLSPHLFRLGASSLLADIERQVRNPNKFIQHIHRIFSIPYFFFCVYFLFICSCVYRSTIMSLVSMQSIMSCLWPKVMDFLWTAIIQAAHFIYSLNHTYMYNLKTGSTCDKN